ncbi:pyroglutamyl-peptidase 1 [Daktulosphaira vitifoliae]|uniref:pyroglutamyl-peptidase 1 n=1 Tax=Daktulosphaira vitifoliae TaxID=58002 RepID=UPI0021AA14E9|nr:pyroglutamyl-peptidase 1 [Daktulosphaira vitifoliae]
MVEKVIVVTGFGPFRQYKVNSSWEIAKCLFDTGIENELNCKLIKIEVPVSYKDVDEIIPKLWTEYKPTLMVHLGVSCFAKTLTVETTAHGHDYLKEDINGICPDSRCLANDSKLETCLSIDCLKDYDICVSQDAGRYLCEYIYHKSLTINKNQTIFIHVPELSEDNTAQKLAKHLKLIIAKLLEQLN